MADAPTQPAREDLPQRKHTERVPLREEGSTSSEEMEPMETEAREARLGCVAFSERCTATKFNLDFAAHRSHP